MDMILIQAVALLAAFVAGGAWRVGHTAVAGVVLVVAVASSVVVLFGQTAWVIWSALAANTAAMVVLVVIWPRRPRE